MAEVKFIYFEGCPNAERTQITLKQVGVAFDIVRQDDLPEDSPYRNYSSPTILQAGKVIFGCEVGEGSGGCSLEVATVDDLKVKLNFSSSS